MTLTKRELVARISEATGLPQIQAAAAMQTIIAEIIGALAKGDKVELRNFGVFEVKIRNARIGRNLQQPGVAVPIAARAAVKFKAGKEMHDAVLKLTPTVGKTLRPPVLAAV